ncbi:MAG: hypothetical protein NTW19_17270 [Planctomycetota bacterium]|nr:hypothetical protein [Planctomycetota bacterium]
MAFYNLHRTLTAAAVLLMFVAALYCSHQFFGRSGSNLLLAAAMVSAAAMVCTVAYAIAASLRLQRRVGADGGAGQAT